MLPWSARGFSGFRLLTEYFAFPEKFLFLDFTRMDAKTLVVRAAIGWRSSSTWTARCQNWSARSASSRWHWAARRWSTCSAQRCEPITLNHTDIEYRVVPDARRPRAAEIWSVERVRETLPDGSFRPWRPFHRLTEGDPDAGVPGGFYHIARRAAAPGVPGTEVFLAPHDPDFDPDRPAEAVLSIDALCVNRDLPTDLPFGGGHPRLRLVEGAAAVAALTCRHRRHTDAAPAAARRRLLAPGLAPVARPSVGHRRRPRARPR